MEDLNKAKLKLQAYKESFESKIASVIGEYEDRIADLRVELTIMNSELHSVRQQLESERSPDVEKKEDASTEE